MVQRQARSDSPGQGLCDLSTLGEYCREAGIELIVLFGSHARGQAGPGSDVDLAVQPARGVEIDKLRLIFDLGELFSPHEVDVVTLSSLTSPLLLHEIFFNGLPLFEAGPGQFQKGRMRAWKLYVDTAPLRQRQKEALARFIERMHHVP
ncbi:MAG: nucleotidyltransferase family protein [Syntrophobacteraceae bacterium]